MNHYVVNLLVQSPVPSERIHPSTGGRVRFTAPELAVAFAEPKPTADESGPGDMTLRTPMAGLKSLAPLLEVEERVGDTPSGGLAG